MVVAEVLKLETIPSMDTCKEEMLKTIRICAMAITTMGIQDACCSASMPTCDMGSVAMTMTAPLTPWVTPIHGMGCRQEHWLLHHAAGFEANRFSLSRSERNFVASWPLMLLPASSNK